MFSQQKPSSNEPDDLFQPSLKKQAPIYVDKPWALENQFWVAFFGGTLAITVLAYLNSQRFKMTIAAQRRILLVGLAGVFLTIILAVVLGGMDLPDYWAEGRAGRMAGRVVAILTYLVLHRLQVPANRLYRAFYDGRYESLWQVGVVIVLVVGAIQGLLVYVVTAFVG